MGDEFLRTLTPSNPAQPKKKKCLERVTADWQTEWKTKSDTQQRQQRDGDSGVKRKVWNEQGLREKKRQRNAAGIWNDRGGATDGQRFMPFAGKTEHIWWRALPPTLTRLHV